MEVVVLYCLLARSFYASSLHHSDNTVLLHQASRRFRPFLLSFAMAAAGTEAVNPFDDPETLASVTLSVGRNASLTLGTDALVVLGTSDLQHQMRLNCTQLTQTSDEAFPDKKKNNIANCFGLLSGGTYPPHPRIAPPLTAQTRR